MVSQVGVILTNLEGGPDLLVACVLTSYVFKTQIYQFVHVDNEKHLDIDVSFFLNASRTCWLFHMWKQKGILHEDYVIHSFIL